MEQPRVALIGTCIIDTKGRAEGTMVPGTSNPGTIRVSAGGVGRNVAENLARLGMEVTLLSAVGDDEAGRHILRHTREVGVNVDDVVISEQHHTGAYMAVLDAEGTPTLSISDTRIIEEVTPSYIYRHRRIVRDASMVVIDANLPPETIETILRLAQRYNVPVCADPTAVGLIEKLRPHLPGLYMITPNIQEAEAYCGRPTQGREGAIAAAKDLVKMGVKVAIVTLAEFGVVYATSAVSGHVPAVQGEVVDLTGAGDALTAGVVFGLLNDLPIDEAVRIGAAAAALTLQTRETVHPELSLERVYDQM